MSDECLFMLAATHTYMHTHYFGWFGLVWVVIIEPMIPTQSLPHSIGTCLCVSEKRMKEGLGSQCVRVCVCGGVFKQLPSNQSFDKQISSHQKGGGVSRWGE